jgi:hypothetical protein
MLTRDFSRALKLIELRFTWSIHSATSNKTSLKQVKTPTMLILMTDVLKSVDLLATVRNSFSSKIFIQSEF